MVYFTLLLPATCFGSIYSCHLQAEVLFIKKVIYTIGNIVVNCEISHYIFKSTKILPILYITF